MSLMKRAAESRAVSNLANPTSWLLDALGAGGGAASGIAVTQRAAESYTAFGAAVNVIAQDVSTLPLLAYSNLQGGGKQREPDSYMWKLLHDRANPEITNQRLWYLSLRDTLVTGNMFLEVVRDAGGRPVELWYLPNTSTVFRVDDQRWLGVETPSGHSVKLKLGPGGQAIQVMGDGGNTFGGQSVVGQYRESIGLGLATERFGARFFGSGSRPSGHIEYDGTFSDPAARESFRRQWSEAQAGLSNSHRVAILNKGMKFIPSSIPPDDAQFLETRKFQTTEMARIFRLPPHKIQDLEKATYTNIEEQQLDYVTETLRARLVALEQVLNYDLVPAPDRRRIYVEFLIDGLLRGNTTARFAAYNVARMGGWMNADEIRARENMNPLPDGQGQVYWVPLNMANAQQLTELDESTDEGVRTITVEGRRWLGDRLGQRALPEPGARKIATPGALQRSVKGRHRLQRRFVATFEDAIGRTVTRETDRVASIARKQLNDGGSVTGFLVEIGDFYRKHSTYTERAIGPVVESYAAAVWADAAEEVGSDPEMGSEGEELARDLARTIGVRAAVSSEGQLRKIVTETPDDDVIDAVETRLSQWSETKAGKMSRRETVQAGATIAKQAWVAAGITELVWRTVGDNCPMCDELDGAVVGIEREAFVQAGESVENPDGTNITPTRNVLTPPLHEGCDCSVTPG